MGMMQRRDEVGRKKLAARVAASHATITKALIKAGLKVAAKNEDSNDGGHRRSVVLDGKDKPSIVIDALVRFSYSSYCSGDEPLVVRIGPHPPARVRSAKDDLDLNGKRVPQIVAAIIRMIDVTAAKRKDARERDANDEVSFKIAKRLNALVKKSFPTGDPPIEFGSIEARPDMVKIEVTSVHVLDSEARLFIEALTPIFKKLEEQW